MSWKGCECCFDLHGTDQYCPAPHPFNCLDWAAMSEEERKEILEGDDE